MQPALSLSCVNYLPKTSLLQQLSAEWEYQEAGLKSNQLPQTWGPSGLYGFPVLEGQREDEMVGRGRVRFPCGLRGQGLAGSQVASCEEGKGNRAETALLSQASMGRGGNQEVTH